MEYLDPAPSDINDDRLRRLWHYWAGKRGGRAMPARADIDPLDLRFILGELILVDILRSPLRFRIRLHGTTLALRAGYELTGKMLDELPVTEFRDFAIGSFTRVVTARVPLCGVRHRVMDGRTHRYEALLLPLSAEGADVDMLLIGMRYGDVG